MTFTASPPAEDLNWQRYLRPFMIVMIAGVTLFYCIGSVVQISSLNRQLGSVPEIAAQMKLAMKIENEAPDPSSVLSGETRARVLLEAHGLERRYHQANALLLTRVWAKNIGFLTGMILCLLGATFIFGKFRESTSALAGEAASVKGSINSASPGIILSALGTVILLSSLFADPKIEVMDTPVYLDIIGAAPNRASRPLVLPTGALETPTLKTGRSDPTVAK